MERRKVSRIRIIEDKHQLIAYVLIVFVAIIGFFVTEHQANEQDKKDRHSREILCNAIQQQSGGSVVTIDQIVALVVDNPPPPGSPQQYIDQYKKSVVIMNKFGKDTKALLPVLDCNKIILGRSGTPGSSPTPSKGQP